MEKLFVPYNIALSLKEKGFDDACLAYFLDGKLRHCLNGIINDEPPIMTSDHNGLKGNKSLFTNYVSAPLYQQVIDWLREKHKIYIYINPFDEVLNFQPCILFKWAIKDRFVAKEFSTYNQAQNESIEEALKLI